MNRGLSQKFPQSLSRLFGSFLEHPMTGVFEHDNGHIGANQFHLLSEQCSVGVVAADSEDRHGQI